MSRVKNFDDRIYFNISKKDKDKLKLLAKLNDLSVNAYIRKLINHQLEIMENQMMIYRAEKEK